MALGKPGRSSALALCLVFLATAYGRPMKQPHLRDVSDDQFRDFPNNLFTGNSLANNKKMKLNLEGNSSQLPPPVQFSRPIPTTKFIFPRLQLLFPPSPVFLFPPLAPNPPSPIFLFPPLAPNPPSPIFLFPPLAPNPPSPIFHFPPLAPNPPSPIFQFPPLAPNPPTSRFQYPPLPPNPPTSRFQYPPLPPNPPTPQSQFPPLPPHPPSEYRSPPKPPSTPPPPAVSRAPSGGSGGGGSGGGSFDMPRIKKSAKLPRIFPKLIRNPVGWFLLAVAGIAVIICLCSCCGGPVVCGC